MNRMLDDASELIAAEPLTNKQRVFRSTSRIEFHNLDNLIPFKDHPFALYEGQRFTDMVESVRANGVIVPIVVRPADDGKYEILSGHNRVNAAKEAGIDSIPALIRTGLTDEEAMLIVTETNLMQRSFADLKHSERAVALAVHYEAIKMKPGYRSDLIEEIEELSGAPLGHRLKTRDKLGLQYGLGKTTIARYLRINKLIPELKELLDRNEIGMRAAEALSFLKSDEQAILVGVLGDLPADGKKVSITQADILKEKSSNEDLTKSAIIEILYHGYSDSTVKPVKLSGQFLSKHFSPEHSADEIEKIISAALDMYFGAEDKTEKEF